MPTSTLRKKTEQLGQSTPLDLLKDLILLKGLIASGLQSPSRVGMIPGQAVKAATTKGQEAGQQVNKVLVDLLNTPINQLAQGNLAHAAEPVSREQKPAGPVMPSQLDPGLSEDRMMIEKERIRRKAQQVKEAMDLQGPEATMQRQLEREQEFDLQAATQATGQQPFAISPQTFGEMLFQKRGMAGPDQFQTGGLLANFFDAAAQATGGTSILDQLLKAQELTGQQPLQAGEREKMALESFAAIQQEMATAGLEGLTPENAQKFSQLLEGRDATVEVDSLLFGGDVGLFGTGGRIMRAKLPGFLKSQRGRQYQAAIERMIQMKTRVETGAAMAPSELKSTMKRYMPRAGDTEETIRKRLSPLFDFFNQGIAIADPTGIHSQRAAGARQRYQASQTGQTLPGTIQVTSVVEE